VVRGCGTWYPLAMSARKSMLAKDKMDVKSIPNNAFLFVIDAPRVVHHHRHFNPTLIIPTHM
jgi:hypothetical protein